MVLSCVPFFSFSPYFLHFHFLLPFIFLISAKRGLLQEACPGFLAEPAFVFPAPWSLPLLVEGVTPSCTLGLWVQWGLRSREPSAQPGPEQEFWARSVSPPGAGRHGHDRVKSLTQKHVHGSLVETGPPFPRYSVRSDSSESHLRLYTFLYCLKESYHVIFIIP